MRRPRNPHASESRGDLAESLVIFDLLEQGYPVFLPLSAISTADLLVETAPGEFARLQIKTATRSRTGRLVIDTRRRKNQTGDCCYKPGTIDWFVLVDLEDRTCFYVPAPAEPGRSLSLDPQEQRNFRRLEHNVPRLDSGKGTERIAERAGFEC